MYTKRPAAKKKIKDAVLRLIREGADASALTPKGVADAAGLRLSTFQANYASLEHVFFDLENELIDRYCALFYEAVWEPGAAVPELTSFLLQNRGLLQHLCAPERGTEFLEKFNRLSYRMIRKVSNPQAIKNNPVSFDLTVRVFQETMPLILDATLEDRPEQVAGILLFCSRLFYGVWGTETA